jgi:hypothetical protein
MLLSNMFIPISGHILATSKLNTFFNEFTYFSLVTSFAFGISTPHFLHFSRVDGLNIPHEGHFTALAADGGLKHMTSSPSRFEFAILCL